MTRWISALKSIAVVCALAVMVGPFTVQTGFTCSPSYNYELEYLSYEEFRTPVAAIAPRPLLSPGNLVVYEDYLIVVDKESGIHLIDNSDTSNPDPVAYIPVYGASEISVVDDVLYARSHMDLIVIDISNPASAAEVNRLEFFYPYDTFNPWLGSSSGGVGTADPELGIVISVRNLGTASGGCGGSFGGCGFGFGGGGSDASPGGGDSSGTNGSMSATIIVEDNLYALARTSREASLLTVSLQDPLNPVQVSSVAAERRSETLYYHDNAIYVGTEVGVFIYDVTNRNFPAPAGSISHQWQCDPVVVDGDWGYSTLRSGRNCGGWTNELHVLDVSDIDAPTLVSRVALESPHGLAIESNLLFITDGWAGLKVYDVANPDTPIQVAQVPSLNVRDVIVKDGWGVMVGRDGVVQFDYTDIDNIQLISSF